MSLPVRFRRSMIRVGAAALVAAAAVPATPALAQMEGGPDAWKLMCTAQETAIRGCVMRSGKLLAFCIPKGQDFQPGDDPDAPGTPPSVSYMQYRFGQVGAPELVYPTRLAGSARKFQVNWYLPSRGAITRISFRRGSYTYRYSSLLIARGQGQGHSVTHGIGVWRDGRRLSFLSCSDHHP